MRDLEQIQRWLQAVIMNPGGARAGIASAAARQALDVTAQDVEQVVTRSQALSALERLGVYSRAYFARLLECLREELPVVRHAVGDEAFDAFALDYLQKHPSRSYTLNQLGARFPRYLEESRPTDDEPHPSGVSLPDFLIDLATLELTYNDVFDGPGVEGQELLDADRLASLPPERWQDGRLVPVCCLRLLALRYPVHQYFTAVRKGRQPGFPHPAPTFLAITRRNYVVRRYPLTPVQYVLLDGLVTGRPVGEALLRAAEAAGPGVDDLAARLRDWFRHWTAEGFFQDFRLAV